MGYGTTLGGFELEHPLMNAAGTCKTIEDVVNFARSAVSAIVLGSITVEERAGNSGDVYYQGQHWSLNSLGMPNPGIEVYKHLLVQMSLVAKGAGKPLVVSAAGFNATDYSRLAYEATIAGADIIELNLGCPNVWDGGIQKRIASFDTDYIAEILASVRRWVGPVGVKLSPYTDPVLLEEVAQVLIAAGNVMYVATTNTFPNSILLDNGGNPVIDVGYAGMGGVAMKPVGLGQAKKFRELLPEDIQVVGVGGIETGQDIVDYRLVGASAVQAATAYWNGNHDPKVFGDMLSGYTELVPLGG